MSEQTIVENNSGMGKDIQVPEVVAKRFNWGAFLLSWIWGLGNGTYITLIGLLVCFIPFVGGLIALGCSIWFGIKGNEWAWQNKRFNDVEHFHSYQRKWATAGVIVLLLSFVFWFFLVMLAALLGSGQGSM